MSEGSGDFQSHTPIDQTTGTAPPVIETNPPGPRGSLISRLRRGLGEVVGSLDTRDRRIAPEDISDLLVADAVDRLTLITRGNPFDVKSVVAEFGYYGDPSSNPEYLRAETETRRRLLSLQERGALVGIVLKEPNQHDQRLAFRVTDGSRKILRQIVDAGKK